MMNKEAQKFVWEGSIPLQIHLHESQVTTVPPPQPALILAPRLGYLPLLASQIKPYFSATLPPGGVDNIWFEYKGLPLKWYIPTGVLFDLLCAEPERPWNLTVHFRGYPTNILIPCKGEDCVKWNFINALKEAAYIINGNCKNVMNMSQADQVELWRSVLNGNLDAYTRISSKLKLGIVSDETDVRRQDKGGKVPVRLYVWSVGKDVDDLEDATPIDSWDKVSYINQPVDVQEEAKAGKFLTLHGAVRSLLPDYFPESYSEDESSNVKGDDPSEPKASCVAEIKLVRVQGIEPKPEIPFSWVASNLMNPDYFLHICVCLKVPTEHRDEDF